MLYPPKKSIPSVLDSLILDTSKYRSLANQEICKLKSHVCALEAREAKIKILTSTLRKHSIFFVNSIFVYLVPNNHRDKLTAKLVYISLPFQLLQGYESDITNPPANQDSISPNHLVYLPHTYQANIPLVLNHAPPGTKELDTVPIAQSVLRLFNLASLYWFPLPAFPTENVIKALSHALPFTPVSAT